MEKSHNYRVKISSLYLIIFVIQFSCLSLFAFSYEIPDQYFINCGSDQNVNDNQRSFTGDQNRDLNSVVYTKQNSSVTSTNQSLNDTSTIYSSARIFRQQSSYAFQRLNLSSPSTYLVRLHFLAFDSEANLSEAVFDVSASSGALLLHNFSVETITKTPMLQELYVTVSTKNFQIYFTPRESSFAFVNAIEFFPAPPVNFSIDEAAKVGIEKRFASSSVLQTVYRINVGGERIEPDWDKIWGWWDTDDKFLITKDNAANSSVYTRTPNYSSDDARFAAPDLVYRTAKELKIGNTSETSDDILTWNFRVNMSSGHLVRAHFCDIISTSLDTIHFNFSLNEDFSQEVNSMEYTTDFAQAMYFDFVVGPISSGVLIISIFPANVTTVRAAFLNGLEILEVKEGLAAVPMDDEDGPKSKLPVVIGSVLGGILVVCVLLAVFFLLFRRKKAKPSTDHSNWGQVVAMFGGGSTHSRVTELTINSSPVPNLQLGLKIAFSEIQLATKSFNSKLLIGSGGFGAVYRGTLLNGTKVAVKRGAPGSGQGLPEFQTEIMILSRIRHRHLVSLIGYCDEREEMILVYEYMEKGTLRDHLYNSNLPRLSWKQRLEICIGSASGLNYLHKGSSGRIIHRDVKSTNILLDENFIAKVADFGLSKSGPLDDSYVSTNVKGTLGYLDPEYFRTQQLTEKSDVYSFGVVLLEILCARPAIDVTLPREQMNLAEWAMKCKSKGVLGDIVDSSIKGQINPNSLRKFGETAEKCLQEDSSDRPTMSDVIWDLEYSLQLQLTPAAREPHEDSTATASGFSAALVMPDIRRIPSLGMNDDMSRGVSTDFSGMSASEVFSLLRRDGAR